MVEVIKRGPKKYIRCKECGSVLAYHDKDQQIMRNKFYIFCPECKGFNITKESVNGEIKEYWKDNVDEV